jgi:hypothetical protein
MDRVNRKVFVDTMVFLHFRPLRELNLPGLVQASSVTLIVPRITLKELDKHKSVHSSKKIRDRAQRILAELEKSIVNQQPLNDGTAVEFWPDFPHEQLTRMRLNPEWADDVLIASVTAYMEGNPESNVAVVSQDSGIRITCYSHGIAAFQLDDTAKLPVEPDEAERELKALREENSRLKSAMPRFEVRIEGGTEPPSNPGRFILQPHPEFDELKHRETLARFREAYPKKFPPGVVDSKDGLGKLSETMNALTMQLSGTSPEKIKQYNAQLELFFSKYDSFGRRLHAFYEKASRTIAFAIAVENTGTAPADDVEVLLHVSGKFKIYRLSDAPKEPEEPMPPPEPRSDFDDMMRGPIFDPSYLRDHLAIQPVMPVSSLEINNSDGWRIRKPLGRIKHGSRAVLPMLCVEFPSLSEASSFSCNYSIQPANLTQPVNGTLNFIVECSTQK